MAIIRAYDPAGTLVGLGKVLGRGGEGAVYDIQGRPDFVAKIYDPPKTTAHGEKLMAMVLMAEPQLLSLAAWPTSTLHGSSGSVIGFIMRKLTGYTPVFKLYIPKLRLHEFPRADWRFPIHAAANAARAFSNIHAAGHVVGDVNHGNLFVGQDATVRLIDCDSFQVSKGPRRWLCEVGVGTHQPPEMQLPSYVGVTRTANHDNFGLAVIIFQMLCMGRHPFAGRYLGSGNPPTIEEAIAKSQYAYSRDQRRTMMAPPPGSLPIDALTPDLQALFETAFAPSATNRPSGGRWVTALEQIGAGLRECNQKSGPPLSLQASALPVVPNRGRKRHTAIPRRLPRQARRLNGDCGALAGGREDFRATAAAPTARPVPSQGSAFAGSSRSVQERTDTR